METEEEEEEGPKETTIDNLPATIYCDIVETLRDYCGQGGVMGALFNYDENLIRLVGAAERH